MRARSIQGVPGLDPNATPFERLEKFARMIAQIPKAEADKETGKPDTVRANGKKPRERKMRRG
jgi:hypothetical protein